MNNDKNNTICVIAQQTEIMIRDNLSAKERSTVPAVGPDWGQKNFMAFSFPTKYRNISPMRALVKRF